MAEPLLPVPNRPYKPKPDTSTVPTNEADVIFYGTGTALFLSTQYFSKSYPRLAEKVSENVIGPEVAAGRLSFKYPTPNLAMLLLPAPFGYMPPTKYGGQPNYMAGVNKVYQHDLGGKGYLLPPSDVLKTLPDTDPRVQLELYDLQADKQREELEKITRNATLEELLDLYKYTQSSQGKSLFWYPEQIAEDLQLRINFRVGDLVKAQKLTLEVRNEVIRTERLPLQAARPNAIPSALNVIPAPGGGNNNSPEFNADVLAQLQRAGIPVPLDSPPTDARQEGAWRRAGELVKQLVTERADP